MNSDGANGDGANERGLSDIRVQVLRRRLADGPVWLAVDGPSMSPALTPPARVLLDAAARPRPGELWAFGAHDGSLVVHRCLRRRRDGTYEFRGDAELGDDAPVPTERLVGRVVRAESATGPVRLTRGWRHLLASRWRGLRRVIRRAVGRTQAPR
jgi:phage repressor protein C with HTH and peptisase S24 domain